MGRPKFEPVREAGTYHCDGCGYLIALREGEELPACPMCGATKFRRHSLFDPRDPFGATTETQLEATGPLRSGERPPWLEELAAELSSSEGCFLVYETADGGIERVELAAGWTRIGRSIAAQVRLDDPTVSRRHALVYVDEAGARILDDRSLNGVFVNGERVELAELEHGDEVTIGRYRLFFISGGYSHENRAAPTAGLESAHEDAVA